LRDGETRARSARDDGREGSLTGAAPRAGPEAALLCAKPIGTYKLGMDFKFWTKELREAERELDAATTRSALDAAAKKLQRATAELKRLEADSAKGSKRRATLGSGSAGASA
jgi:hypothetical protein